MDGTCRDTAAIKVMRTPVEEESWAKNDGKIRLLVPERTIFLPSLPSPLLRFCNDDLPSSAP
jgi:hypothetical protein